MVVVVAVVVVVVVVVVVAAVVHCAGIFVFCGIVLAILIILQSWSISVQN